LDAASLVSANGELMQRRFKDEYLTVRSEFKVCLNLYIKFRTKLN